MLSIALEGISVGLDMLVIPMILFAAIYMRNKVRLAEHLAREKRAEARHLRRRGRAIYEDFKRQEAENKKVLLDVIEAINDGIKNFDANGKNKNKELTAASGVLAEKLQSFKVALSNWEIQSRQLLDESYQP